MMGALPRPGVGHFSVLHLSVYYHEPGWADRFKVARLPASPEWRRSDPTWLRGWPVDYGR